MKDRCCNPRSQRYDRYGARGISVCERWLASFDAFFADLGARPTPEHSLERVNNNGNYEPSNVVWAVRELQNNNKSTNKVLDFKGESLTVTQWARKTGIEQRTLYARLDAGWSIESALTTKTELRTWRSSPGFRYTDEQKESVVQLVASGMTITDAVKSCGMSLSRGAIIVKNCTA
jgi:hypothetical protein